MEQGEHLSIVDFYTDVVLPALAERLDSAFPEFGWRRDARGWVATNEELTHRALGVRAERVVAHGPAPRGFLIHGGEPMLWTAYLSGGVSPRGGDFVRAVKEIAGRAGVDTALVERPVQPDRGGDLLACFVGLCQQEIASGRGEAARKYLVQRGLPVEAMRGAASVLSRIGLVQRGRFRTLATPTKRSIARASTSTRDGRGACAERGKTRAAGSGRSGLERCCMASRPARSTSICVARPGRACLYTDGRIS
jgi:hypothetical protein